MCLLLFSQTVNSQTFTDTVNTESKTLSRLKLAGGYASGKFFEADGNTSFFDFGYRATELNKDSQGFEFGLSFDAGIIIYTNGFFPFYVKAGPEIKFGDFIMGADFGYMTLTLWHFPVSAYGFNGSRLFKVSKNIYLELESGINFGIEYRETPILYVNLGFSVN